MTSTVQLACCGITAAHNIIKIVPMLMTMSLCSTTPGAQAVPRVHKLESTNMRRRTRVFCPAGSYHKNYCGDDCVGVVFCAVCPMGGHSKAGATSESNCTASGREYLGCYKDAFSITEARDLSEKRVAMGAGASLQMCRRICHGYRYLGLQAVDECRCGHSYGKYGVAFDKRVKSGVFTSASDLDFQGTFKYALNFGAAAGGQRIGDALFTQMRTAPKTPNVVCLR